MSSRIRDSLAVPVSTRYARAPDVSMTMRVNEVSVIKTSGPTESKVRTMNISITVDISVPLMGPVNRAKADPFMVRQRLSDPAPDPSA